MNERFTTHDRGLTDAPVWLSIILPATVYPVLMLAIFIYQPFYRLIMHKEGGIEWMTVIALLCGVAYGLTLLVRYRRHLPAWWLVAWFGLGTLGMFVLAGEEISWGQHLGLWTHDDLPEAWNKINDQQETNFHNLTNTLDQGPTNLVVLATFIAFVVNPLWLRWRRETMKPDNPGYWLWPTRAGFVTALGVLIVPFPKRIYEWVTGEEGPSLMRHSELHEFYIALLMAVYMVSTHHRLRAMAGAQTAQPTANSVPA